MSLGNKTLKGACCGGFSLWTEEFVWSMFENGYPRHHVQDVVPMQVNQIGNWEGTDGSGLQVLFGWFSCNGNQASTLALEMFSSDGVVNTFFENGSDPLYQPAPMAAVGVFTSVEFPWQFSGWLVQLQGPAIEAGGLQINFVESIGGSYPSIVSIDSSHNLTMLSPVYSFDGNIATLPYGSTFLRASLDFNRLQIGATGVYEEYTPEQLTAMFRIPEGTLTVESFNIVNSTTGRVVFTIDGIFNPSTDCTWLEDVAVLSDSSDIAYTIDNDGIKLYNEDEELIATCTVGPVSASKAEGYVKGLGCCKNRIIEVTGENGSGFPTDVDVVSFGASMSFSMSAIVGLYEAVNTVDFLRADLEDILYRQPVFTVKIGIPA